MKTFATSVAAFARDPGPNLRLALVYGTDTGLVRETADLLAKSVVDDLADPFRVARINPDKLSEDPTLLHDEAAAIAFGGGRRVIQVDGAREGHAATVAAFLENPPGDTLVILQSEMLSPRNRLRVAVEVAPNAMALPCFADEGGRLDAVIRESLAGESLSAEPEALAYLASHLGGDRLATRRELEKLAIFIGPGRAEPIRLDEAAACVGDVAALALVDLAYAVAEGNPAAVERCYARALAEGVAAPRVVRAVGRHVQSLIELKAALDGGKPLKEAARRLRPPAFGPNATRVQTQAKFLSYNVLARFLELLIDAEIKCKSTGPPASTVCADVLMRLCVRASQAARGVNRRPAA